MKQYIVDAFTDKVFSGNQAAVIVVDDWPDEELMKSITRENNFSETAYIKPEGERWHLRWFTPSGEIDLCGHATLASAYVLLNFFVPEADRVEFTTLSGVLIVERQGDLLRMEFPTYELHPVPVTDAMEDALGVRPVEAYMGRDLLCVLPSEKDVRELAPSQEKILGLEGLLCHVTARGSGEFDCVSRSFAPKHGIPEDPVCGSGHCHVAPYWANKLGKSDLVAYQASARGGTLYCHVDGPRTYLAGPAALYSISELQI